MARANDRDDPLARGSFDGTCEVLVPFIDQGFFQPRNKFRKFREHIGDGFSILQALNLRFTNLFHGKGSGNQAAAETQLVPEGNACPSSFERRLDISVREH